MQCYTPALSRRRFFEERASSSTPGRAFLLVPAGKLMLNLVAEGDTVVCPCALSDFAKRGFSDTRLLADTKDMVCVLHTWSLLRSKQGCPCRRFTELWRIMRRVSKCFHYYSWSVAVSQLSSHLCFGERTPQFPGLALATFREVS